MTAAWRGGCLKEMKNEEIACQHDKWKTKIGEHLFKKIIFFFKFLFCFRFHNPLASYRLEFPDPAVSMAPLG
jgi:hypothetical protein